MSIKVDCHEVDNVATDNLAPDIDNLELPNYLADADEDDGNDSNLQCWGQSANLSQCHLMHSTST